MSEEPVLRRGDEGGDVQRLQEALAAAGYDPGVIDGFFGEDTEAAVTTLQADNGLDIDGVAGTETWGVLDGVLGNDTDSEISEEVFDESPAESAPETFTAEEPEAPETADQDWAATHPDVRRRHVMTLLVGRYGYPVNGAAGIVGNLYAESGLLPNRVEGSSASTPMRARDFAGDARDFSAEEVMDRDFTAKTGPAKPGIGLAQWTSASRRRGLFAHTGESGPLGAAILFDMDAQVDYLNTELRSGYPRVYAVVSEPSVSVEDASDEVVYSFEVPGSILSGGSKLPRTDPGVQQTFQRRRDEAADALSAYMGDET